MKKLYWWILAIIVLFVTLVGVDYHYATALPNCPHETIDRNYDKPYPNVKADYGIEVYHCRFGKDLHIVKEKGKYY